MNELDVGDAVEVWFKPWEDEGPKHGKIIEREAFPVGLRPTEVWHYRVQFDGQTIEEAKGGRWWPVGRVQLGAQAPEVQALVSAALDAQDLFTPDELEEHAHITTGVPSIDALASNGIDPKRIDWFGEGSELQRAYGSGRIVRSGDGDGTGLAMVCLPHGLATCPDCGSAPEPEGD